ncbi:MAG: ribonuclease P protein component [bacterium]|nr:ribonuclease P protein component [bacterium]
MLPKKHRLSKSAEVKQTTARGRSFFNPCFILKSIPALEGCKVTVIVSTKVSKKAVDRNRLKRVIREVVREALPRFKPGTYAFIVKLAAMKITSAELKEQVSQALKASKVIS